MNHRQPTAMIWQRRRSIQDLKLILSKNRECGGGSFRRRSKHYLVSLRDFLRRKAFPV
jgi:hypothetical protein